MTDPLDAVKPDWRDPTDAELAAMVRRAARLAALPGCGSSSHSIQIDGVWLIVSVEKGAPRGT